MSFATAPQQTPDAPSSIKDQAPVSPIRLPSASPAPTFSINFIRQERIPLSVRRLLVSILLGYLAVNAVLFVALTGTAVSAHLQWRALRRTLQAAPSADAGNEIGRDMARLQDQAQEDLATLTAGVAQQRQRFPVAGKLAALTKTIPPRTWITSLSGKRDGRTLAIRAAYVVDPAAPYTLPMKGWMDALKADPSFGRGLKQLRLAASSRKTQGAAELVVFEMLADWQPLTDHE